MPKLSVIILSYNTKELTFRCLTSLFKSLQKSSLDAEVIVVDNNSKDGSIAMLEEIQNLNSKLKIIKNQENYGYPKGNNQGLRAAEGEYILFLNSDVVIEKVDFVKVLSYMDEHKDVGGLTVRVNLSSNGIDPASHRGFPTIWNSFTYFFKLEQLTKNIPLLNRIFGGYHLTNLNLNRVHEIDSPSGAFFLTRRNILNKTGGFDEKFFMYGEDLDLSFRIKDRGFKMIYYPLYRIIHFKHSSGFRKDHFYKAMKIFYQKHYQSKYSLLVNKIVYLFIDLIKRLNV